MTKIHAYRMSCVILGIVGTAQVAQAQIGSGWTSISLSKSTDTDGCGSISGSTHKITCSGGTGWQRAEYKLGSSASGQRQFQGDLKVVSLSGTGICVKQTFKGPSTGAFFMLTVRSASGGQLYDHGNSGAGTFMSSVIGKTIRVNTVLDTGANTHKAYINGSLKNTRDTGGHDGFFDKYGAYKTTSGTGPATIQWTGIKTWRK